MSSISATGAVGFSSEIAVLLLENESNLADSQKLARDAARESYMANVQEQVDQLHEAADATRNGALFGAAVSVGAGALQIGATSYQYKADVAKANGVCGGTVANLQLESNLRQNSGKLLGELGGAAKTFVFDSAVSEHQAQAKLEESQAEQAKWQASDASTSIDKANKAVDKYLDLLQGIQRDEHGANNAIIGRI